jgi:hypothetical protein
MKLNLLINPPKKINLKITKKSTQINQLNLQSKS